MGNCLVTKLKGVVDNPNLEYLDYVKLHGKFIGEVTEEDNAFACANEEEAAAITLIEGDATLTKSDKYVKVMKGTQDEFTLLIPKYTTTNMSMYETRIQWDLAEICKIYGLLSLTFSGTSKAKYLNENLTELTALKQLTTLDIAGANFTGNISTIALIPTIQTLRLAYDANITGDLSSIKDMPNLTTVTLNPTVVTDNDNTVAYLQSRGVTVTYSTYTPT